MRRDRKSYESKTAGKGRNVAEPGEESNSLAIALTVKGVLSPPLFLSKAPESKEPPPFKMLPTVG